MLSLKTFCNSYRGKCTPACQRFIVNLLTHRANALPPQYSKQYVTKCQQNFTAINQQNSLFSRWLVQYNKFQPQTLRQMSSQADMARKNKSGLIYVCAIGVFMVGMTYAGVPLYRMFCQVDIYTSYVKFRITGQAHSNTL